MLRDFEAAVERFQRKVCTLATYILGDRGEAEDVTQEVLLKMWRHWKKLKEGSLEGWVLRVTRNACIDRIRGRARRGRYETGELAEGFIERAPEPGPGPAAVVEGNDLGRRIAAELARLSEPYRSIVILREIQGLKYQEIAEVLKLPINTVKVYLHRGRLRLREGLGEEEAHAARA